MSLSDSRQALADSCDAIYQPLSSRVLRDPYPVFHRLRSSGSVRWHAHLDSWVVPSHSACSVPTSSHRVPNGSAGRSK